jgi:hypothetical protein
LNQKSHKSKSLPGSGTKEPDDLPFPGILDNEQVIIDVTKSRMLSTIYYKLEGWLQETPKVAGNDPEALNIVD